MDEIKNSYEGIRDYVNYKWDRSLNNFFLTFARQEWIISPDIIGSGEFSSVHLAILATDKDKSFSQLMKEKKIMAVKVYTSSLFLDNHIDTLIRYQNIYSPFYPPNMRDINFYELTNRTHYRVALIMPLFPGSLRAFHNNLFAPDKTPKYFSPVLSITAIIACMRALNLIHEKALAHLDLKIDNIQYDALKELAILVDLDFSRVLISQKKLSPNFQNQGTLGFQAPELYNNGVPRYNYQTDYYALAAVVICLLGVSENELLNKKEAVFDRYNDRLKVTQAPYVFKKEHLKKHFSALDILKLSMMIKKLGHTNYLKRPKDLEGCIRTLELILTKWLNKGKKEHQKKMTCLINEVSHFNHTQLFFKPSTIKKATSVYSTNKQLSHP